MMIKKNSKGISLYSLVESTLRQKILNGEFQPGDKLPTEEELSELFKVSRITVRTSLTHLEAEKLIERRRPLGTFVADVIPTTQQNVLSSLADMIREIETNKMELALRENIQIRKTKNSNILKSFFNLSSHEELVHIQRIFLLSDIPIALFDNYLPIHIGRHILKKDVLSVHSINKLIKEKMGLTIGRAEMELEAVPADADVSPLLACQIFDPLLHVWVSIWLPSGAPLEIVDVHLRADYYRYKVPIDVTGY